MSEALHSNDRRKKPKMTTCSWKLGDIISKGVEILLGLFLIGLFISEVVIAFGKWKQDKTSISTSTYYDEYRLMPSFSICFRTNMEHYGYNGTEVELGLNITKYGPWTLTRALM